MQELIVGMENGGGEQENIYRKILGSNRKMGGGGLRERCLELQRGQVSYEKSNNK